jgi:hypothetical protein
MSKSKTTIRTTRGEWVLELNAEDGTATVLSFSKPEPSTLQKAASWAKAEMSQVISGPLSDEQYEARVAVCRSCDQLDPADAPQIGYCKACGCGKRPRAEITVKGRMPAATCPKKKWPTA